MRISVPPPYPSCQLALPATEVGGTEMKDGDGTFPPVRFVALLILPETRCGFPLPLFVNDSLK